MPILKSVITFFLIVCFVFLSLRYIESRTLFYPAKNIISTPETIGLLFQEIDFKTEDNVKLNGWFIPAEHAEYCVIFFHGNAGNISHRLAKLKFFHDLGCNVFIFDYEGYGKSSGRPSEERLYEDSKAAYKYLITRGISVNRIIGYGESIGGAVVVDLASKELLKAIILDSTLTSVKDMIKYAYPFLPYWIFSSRFDSEFKIKGIKIPKLLIHSQDDEIIPYQLGRKLYENSPQPKEFLQIHGGHNSNFFESESILRKKIADFLAGLGATTKEA